MNDTNGLVKALIYIAFVLVGLIGLSVVVGLLRDNLDPSGTVTALSAVVGGIVTGLLIRDKRRGDGDE